MIDFLCPDCGCYLHTHETEHGKWLICFNCQEWYEHPEEVDVVCPLCNSVMSYVELGNTHSHFCTHCNLDSADLEIMRIANLIGIHLVIADDKKFILID